MDGQPQPAAPRGLLGLFGPREDDPRSPADRRRDILANLAIGLSGLSMFPNTAMINALQGGIQERRETRKEALAAEKALQSKSRTVEWLRSQGREDLAAAVEAGALDGKSAAGLALGPREPGYTAMTGKQLNEQFGTMLPEGELYNVSGKGQITKVGGAGVSVNVGGEVGGEGKLRTKLMEKRGEDFASYARAGATSAAALNDLNILQQLAPLAPTGPLQGRFAEMFPEANNVSAVWSSIVNRVAPTLRVEGSGSTSDLEFNSMLRSLGSFRNTPEANAAIIAVMQAKAQYNIDRAAIIRDYENEAITLTEANNRLAALDNQSTIPLQVQRLLQTHSAQSAPVSPMTRDDAADILLGR